MLEFPESFYNVQSLDPGKDVRRLKKIWGVVRWEMLYSHQVRRPTSGQKLYLYKITQKWSFPGMICGSKMHYIIGHICCWLRSPDSQCLPSLACSGWLHISTMLSVPLYGLFLCPLYPFTFPWSESLCQGPSFMAFWLQLVRLLPYWPHFDDNFHNVNLIFLMLLRP